MKGRAAAGDGGIDVGLVAGDGAGVTVAGPWALEGAVGI